MSEETDRYLVVHEYTCPECEGDGWVYNDEWVDANKAHDAAFEAEAERLLSDPNEDDDRFYDRLGAASDAGWQAIKSHWAKQGYYSMKSWPSEELQCPVCKGNGIVRREVFLREALEKIGVER